MRILIALHGFPPTHTAGAERQAERMAHWLIQHDFDVEVFAIENVKSKTVQLETADENGLLVHRLSYDLGKDGGSFRNLYDHPNVVQALTDVLVTKPFDLVHIISGYLLGSGAINAIRSLHIPVIVSPMEYWFLCDHLNLIQSTGELCSGPESDQKCARCLLEMKRRYRIPAQIAAPLANSFWKIGLNLPFGEHMIEDVRERRQQLSSALNAADMVICNSRFLISKFNEFGFDTEHYHYLRQGLAATPQQTPRARPEGSLRVGYIGQIKHHKGVDLLINAVIRLLKDGHPVSLDLWGGESAEPEYSQHLRQQSQPYPSIRWNGVYTGNQVWDILANFDLLVVPSRWYENSPNVILEAHHSHLPVVATRLGGMAEMVQHETNGLLFQLNSVDDLYKQLRRFFTEPDLHDRLQSGITPARTIDEEMQDTVQYYHQLVGQHVT